MRTGVIVKKLGMSSCFLESGDKIPVTLLQMQDCQVVSHITKAKNGYDALVRYNEKEIRRLTIIELKRIQSFPDNYIIDGSNKDIIMQIGNAVACKFAYHLGKYIINTLQ